MSLTRELHEQIEAVCPIAGVSIEDEGNKATWRVDFAPEATQGERAAAQAVIDGFDATAEESKRAAVLDGIKATAQSAGGVLLTDLTQAQIKSLLAVLLYSAGAVDSDGRVRPLGKWVIKRE